MFDDSSHRRSLMIGLPLAFAAIVVTILAIVFAPPCFASTVPQPDDTAHRLAYAARWLALPGLTLLAGVVAAARRGFYADAIGGTRTPANHGLEINLRYNQNTVEQVLLAVIAWPGLALELPRDALPLIPVAAVLFGVGRITFWIGYLLHPMGRAFGMALTAIPALAAYAWLVIRALA